jgi:hypothetical protein
VERVCRTCQDGLLSSQHPQPAEAAARLAARQHQIRSGSLFSPLQRGVILLKGSWVAFKCCQTVCEYSVHHWPEDILRHLTTGRKLIELSQPR